MMFGNLEFDHVGIRVTDLEVAERFYAKFGFVRDPEEFAPAVKACGLVHPTGLRIHLIYNGHAADEGNVLLDADVKRPGYTHAAFIIDSMDDLVVWLEREGIGISEGPLVMGDGRRKACFIRDPDLNVLEFNEILAARDVRSAGRKAALSDCDCDPPARTSVPNVLKGQLQTLASSSNGRKRT